ncbi:Glucan endo-1-3-beta-glucosidase 2, partial [Nymphaea thermarum]
RLSGTLAWARFCPSEGFTPSLIWVRKPLLASSSSPTTNCWASAPPMPLQAAAAWVKTNIASFYSDTAVVANAVGDEVFTTLSSTSPLLLPALESLHNALVASNLNSVVKVSTPPDRHHHRPLSSSQAFFNHTLEQYLLPLFCFLHRTGSPLMLNLYP